MSLQALKLTKENLTTIAETIGANPESLKMLAAQRDKYIMFETMTVVNDRNWTMIGDVQFRQNFVFTEPETNRFIDVISSH
jgi:hypothetical protein